MHDPTRDQACVIVGAGLAGANCAVTLREEGWAGRIEMLGTEPGIPFGRPPLSKTYLRGEEPISAWYVKPPGWYEAYGVEYRAGVTVVGIETSLRQVHLTGGETVGYDKLVICTGGRNRSLRVPGAKLPGIYQLRTLAECDAIRAAARPGARAVIVGMSFIGCEVAASLRQMGLEVTTVLSGVAPLAPVLGDDVASLLARLHRERGVQLVTGDRVVAFEGSDRVERVLTARGTSIECDLVVAGVGIEPAVEALGDGQIALDDGVLVDASCRTSVPDVYAAGDIASHNHPVFGRIRVEHYNNAEKQGQAVARSVLGDPKPYDYIHSFWSDQYDQKLEYVGHARSWDSIVMRGELESGQFLAFYLVKGVMKAAFGLNRGGDPELEPGGELGLCQALIRGQAELTEKALADETVDLRTLAVL